VGITIYDIAEKSGVSIATVSRVFNNYPRVSKSTRARVLAVAEELGYQPHASAQSLARRRTNLVSAVIPMLTNYFYVEVLRGLQDCLASSEYDLLVYSAGTPEESDGQLRAALHRGRSAGVLLFSTPLTEARVDLMKRSGQAIVLVDSFHAAFDSVSVDNVRGGYGATRHCLDLGCRHIGLIMARPTSVPALERRQGYEKALSEAGLPVDERLIVVSREPEHHGYTEEAGYHCMKVLLGLPVRPEAVFVTSDIQALGALRALNEAEIPAGEVALVGFDDIVTSKYVGLTTLRQPMYEIGKLAAEKLLQRIQNPEHPTSHTVFSPRLVRRRSTALRGSPVSDVIGTE
jgi:LacI family transcriptional regulator